MADKYDFSEWLREEMKRRGLNQSDLARAANVTRAAINGIMTGARGPGQDLCNAIAQAFSMPPEEVFRKAGLLPPSHDKSPLTKEADFLMSTMSEAKQKQAVEYIRFLAQQEEQEKESDAAKGMGKIRAKATQ